MKKYFIVENEVQAGPFSIEELSAKGIRKDTLVWMDGLENWTQAGYIPMLKDIILPSPPPIPQSHSRAAALPPPIPVLQSNLYHGYQLAKRRERFMASLIEAIIVFGIMMLLTNGKYWDFDPFKNVKVFTVSGILSAVLNAVYGAIFYPIWSGNLGHKIMGLKVISESNGTDFKSSGQGAWRESIKSIFANFILPIIWLLWDDKRQNLYDKTCGTIVVRKP